MRRAVGAVLVTLATLAAAVVPAVLWPGEIAWINDEPRLIAKAYHANAAGTLADRGLRGNFGFSYGPTATQIYQAMLLVTHDPIALARLRAGLCAGVTALGMLWLARSLRLNPWFATAVVLAPYLWVFQRILWDASFAIPVGTVALAAYAAYLRHGGRGPLLLSLACSLLLPFIHPQDLPLCAPLLAHMLWRHRRRLVPCDRHAAGTAGLVLLVIAAVDALNVRYVKQVSSEFKHYLRVGFPTSYPGNYTHTATLLGPFGLDHLLPAAALTRTETGQVGPPALSRHLLGGHGYMGLEDSGLGAWVERGKRGLSVFFPLLWIGMGATVVGLVRRRLAPHHAVVSRVGAGGAFDAFESLQARQAVAGIALIGVLLQALIAGATRVPSEPQYFFGTFVLHAVLAWVGVDALARFRLSYVAVLAYGLSAAAATVGTMAHYHRPGPPAVPDPANAMPPLGDSVEVARALARYPADIPVVTDIDFYHRFPQAVRALRLLIPPAPDTHSETGRASALVVRMRRDAHPSGLRVQVFEARRLADVPPRARPINLTPLSPRWESGTE